MKLLKKAAVLLLTAALLVGAGCIPALAKTETREKITSVTIHIAAELGDESDFSDMRLSLSAGSGNYSIDGYEILNETGNSAYPLIQITLDAESGWYFDVSTRDIHLEGEEADCTSKSTKNNAETLLIKIKLTDMTSNLPPVSSADLDSDGEGSWTSVPGARKYEVRLYRGNALIGSTKTTSDTHYDFSGMITRKGDYFFKVRAVGAKSSDKSDWTESDGYYYDDSLSDNYHDSNWWYDDDYYYNNGPGSGPSGPGNSYYNDSNSGPGAGPSGTSSGSQGAWCQNRYGWWYRYSNGSYPANAWLYVDSNWFHFDGNGYMQTGWLNDGGRWYYLNPSSDGTKGKMITGWYGINGKSYYFNPNSDGTRGALITNTIIDGKYRVGSDGAWIP